jgi:hypothetical protein
LRRPDAGWNALNAEAEYSKRPWVDLEIDTVALAADVPTFHFGIE